MSHRSAWPSARRSVAALAVLIALATVVAGASLGGSDWPLFGTGAYIAITLVALSRRGVIAVQVLTGQALVASVLLAPGGPGPMRLVPIVAGVVATAELLAIVARLAAPLDRDPRGDVLRVIPAAGVGGVVFGGILLVGHLPGPRGVLAILLAAAGCVILAGLLVVNARPGESRRPAEESAGPAG